MQEVGGSSPPISTDWVRLSVFSACSNLWLLHAFFFGYFWDHPGFYFFECVGGVSLLFCCPIFMVVPSGLFVGFDFFFVRGRGTTHQFFRCGVGCASVYLMRGLEDAGCIL